MAKKIEILAREIRLTGVNDQDYVCLTDIARYKNADASDDLIRNWLRNRNTLEFLGLWEQINNPDFNPVEFDGIKKVAGLNSFTLTPKQWIERTGAIGIQSKAGRYGGTYAHLDIALEFKLYLIKEFQRLKETERKTLGWDIRRNLAKINYRIHTNAIQTHLIPPELGKAQISLVYASEADVLNMALFGQTAAQWRGQATGAQLVCLSNLENLNALFIGQALPQPERLTHLNQIAIQQMKLLTTDDRTPQLPEGKKVK
jgi:hypothetical protein